MQIKHLKRYERGSHILVTFCVPYCAESVHKRWPGANQKVFQSPTKIYRLLCIPLAVLLAFSHPLMRQDQSRCWALVSNILSSQQMGSIRCRGIIFSIYSMVPPDPRKSLVWNYIQSIQQHQKGNVLLHNSDILYLVGLNALLWSFYCKIWQTWRLCRQRKILYHFIHALFQNTYCYRLRCVGFDLLCLR